VTKLHDPQSWKRRVEEFARSGRGRPNPPSSLSGVTARVAASPDPIETVRDEEKKPSRTRKMNQENVHAVKYREAKAPQGGPDRAVADLFRLDGRTVASQCSSLSTLSTPNPLMDAQ